MTDMADKKETYQQDLYGAQDVKGSSKGGSQVQTNTHRSPKFWTQWSGDHVIRATSCKYREAQLDLL